MTDLLPELPLFYPAGMSNYRRDTSMSARFEMFHKENPHVYRELVRLARRLKSRGVERYSVRGLFAALRFDLAIKTRSDDFVLNDHYTPFYARMIMDKETDLKDFFETRERKAD